MQEYGLLRSLQLDPKAAQTWAALGRLYMQAGAGHLADSCFTQARSQDPADPATWTAMGALAGLSATGEPLHLHGKPAHERAGNGREGKRGGAQQGLLVELPA